jgi:putative transposase
MDGRRRCQNNIFIERLWWTVKYQFLYLQSFENGLALRGGIAEWISGYNHVRGHSSLDELAHLPGIFRRDEICSLS